MYVYIRFRCFAMCMSEKSERKKDVNVLTYMRLCSLILLLSSTSDTRIRSVHMRDVAFSRAWMST